MKWGTFLPISVMNDLYKKVYLLELSYIQQQMES